MKTQSLNMKKLIKVFVLCSLIVTAFVSIILAATTDPYCLTPTDDQYLELRAVEVNDVAGQNKQVIMELWGNNIDMKGFDVRFSYDSSKIKPSNIITNELSNDETEYFEWESEFASCMDFFTIDYDGTGDGIRAIISFNPPVTTSDHIKEAVGTGKYVDTTGGVKLGRMSFQMTESIYDTSWFSLVENSDSSPDTGIKINIDGLHNYQAQSTFRFTDMTASKDADLSDIVLSSGEDDSYKTYSLSPTFDKDTLSYDVELLEYIDAMDLTVTSSDANSTIYLSAPKHDTDGNIVYKDDEVTIDYEDIALTSGTAQNIILNKLGAPDTVLKIKVTAEDTVTEKEYTVTIKRPHGTVRGSILTSNTNDIHKADIKTYDSSLGFDWESMMDHEELDEIDPLTNIETEDDGTYEFYIIPGTYDLLIDKPGYLDYIILGIPIAKDEVIDLDEIELVAGDVNKDGNVELEDMGYINDNYDAQDGDPNYEIRFDFTGDGLVDLEDMSLINDNYDSQRIIINY